jgi:plastocyanin
MHAHTLTRPLAVLAGVLLVVGLAACGDDDDASTADDSTTTSEAVAADDGGDAGDATDEAQVEAKDFEFTVLAASVPAGSDVVFANTGSAPHTLTADDGSFDSERVEGGAQATVVAPAEPGDYAFHCLIHPAMTGTLTVVAG